MYVNMVRDTAKSPNTITPRREYSGKLPSNTPHLDHVEEPWGWIYRPNFPSIAH